jgi:hypothetical protein
VKLLATRPGLAVERGGEEQRLALGRALGHDAVDGGLEAHVEHAVGLVEDEDRHAVERQVAALEEVLQAAGVATTMWACAPRGPA